VRSICSCEVPVARRRPKSRGRQAADLCCAVIMSVQSPLLVKPSATHGEYVRVTPETAGWEWLHFSARRLNQGEKWQSATGDFEYGLVVLSGVCSISSSHGDWLKVGRRPNVFSGLPYALYLPGNTTFTVTALSEELDFACGWCKSGGEHP